jgi:signal transduction histidine kinase
LTFLCVPVLVWAAFRFGARETTAAAALLSAMAITATVRGLGPFAAATPNESLLLLQTFLGVPTVFALAFAAVVAENRCNEALRSVNQQARAAAHEINNPLAVIIAGLHLLERDIGAHPRLTRAVEAGLRIQDVVRRMNSITAIRNEVRDTAATGATAGSRP